jgi:hypothetical protein
LFRVNQLLHDPANRRLGRKHEGGDRGCILQCRASYLGRIDYAGVHKVFVLFAGGIEAVVGLGMVLNLLGDDGPLQSRNSARSA